ncbi:hypothetical protein [Lysobacter enzymogenes]|uniref:hypothetical protein n=1 Tax=Lysobacter enzymogenes TaxID=69 RepID=UPI001A9622D1|nr:hypothetical protein [Lysobacter enzymogenes]QQP94741.1 hypothetical protein JHW38_15990 [Lysobacter enzymogenes]
MFRLPLAAALALLLSAPAFAQAPARPAAKPAAVAAAKTSPPVLAAPKREPSAHAPPGAANPQDALYRQSPANARLAEPGAANFPMPSPQPLVRWSEPAAGERDAQGNVRKPMSDRCAHSIKKMREAGAGDVAQREDRARRDCRGG